MGLLFGDCEERADGQLVTSIWAVSALTRSDKRPDRVEIPDEELVNATQQADAISASLGRRTRAVGWYHSHPHITVFPSHVDLRTQAMYQGLHEGFVGLIVSCFTTDRLSHCGRVETIAFQSETLTALDHEQTTMEQSQLMAWANQSGVSEAELRSFIASSTGPSTSESWKRCEIPLQVLPVSSILPPPLRPHEALREHDSLHGMVKVLQLLYQEDQIAMNQALAAAANASSPSLLSPTSSKPSPVHPVLAGFAAGVHQQNVCLLLEKTALPLLHCLRSREKSVRVQLAEAQLEHEKLKGMVAQLEAQLRSRSTQPSLPSGALRLNTHNSTSPSPHHSAPSSPFIRHPSSSLSLSVPLPSQVEFPKRNSIRSFSPLKPQS
eukprot:GILI01027220.1.p1 GENE.GILI01027220.1~~GILI01027220.1.p1  ORF type:complete len:429 (+),score=80.52 GILI01027220.1:150-1289(+)